MPGMNGIGRWGWVQIDCSDPVALATFWSSVLGARIDRPGLGDPPRYLGLVPTSPDQPVVSFQRVPDPKTVKNRVHLDIAVDDVEAATARIEALGGSRHAAGDFSEYGFRWRVMADPEGNEFCLVVQATRPE
jgi:predicted enzyme related to lactoylglutathione lyase